MIPNLFRRLLGEGALTAAFIPIFKEKEKTSSPEEMWRAANAVISGLAASASVISILAMAGISIALALGPYQEKTELVLRLLRIMFPYMLLVCLTAVFIGCSTRAGIFHSGERGAGDERGDDFVRLSAGTAHGHDVEDADLCAGFRGVGGRTGAGDVSTTIAPGGGVSVSLGISVG